jgi:hypothetical protein
MFIRSQSVHIFIVLASFLAGSQNLFPADGSANSVPTGSTPVHGTTLNRPGFPGGSNE